MVSAGPPRAEPEIPPMVGEGGGGGGGGGEQAEQEKPNEKEQKASDNNNNNNPPLGLIDDDDDDDDDLPDPSDEAHVPTLSRSMSSEDEYCCAVCLDLLCQPVTMSCGHTFCVFCACAVVKSRNPKCPTCRSDWQGAQQPAASILIAKTVSRKFPKEAKRRAEEAAAHGPIDWPAPGGVGIPPPPPAAMLGRRRGARRGRRNQDLVVGLIVLAFFAGAIIYGIWYGVQYVLFPSQPSKSSAPTQLPSPKAIEAAKLRRELSLPANVVDWNVKEVELWLRETSSLSLPESVVDKFVQNGIDGQLLFSTCAVRRSQAAKGDSADAEGTVSKPSICQQFLEKDMEISSPLMRKRIEIQVRLLDEVGNAGKSDSQHSNEQDAAALPMPRTLSQWRSRYRKQTQILIGVHMMSPRFAWWYVCSWSDSTFAKHMREGHWFCGHVNEESGDPTLSTYIVNAIAPRAAFAFRFWQSYYRFSPRITLFVVFTCLIGIVTQASQAIILARNFRAHGLRGGRVFRMFRRMVYNNTAGSIICSWVFVHYLLFAFIPWPLCDFTFWAFPIILTGFKMLLMKSVVLIAYRGPRVLHGANRAFR